MKLTPERMLPVAAALRQAAASGVRVLAMECAVTPESMVITKPVPVKLSPQDGKI